MSYSICLKGFVPAEAARVTSLLNQQGHRVVRTMEVAQLVVTGPDAPREIYQTTQRLGVRLLSWEDFRQRHLSSAAATEEAGPVPVVQAAPLPFLEDLVDRIRILDQHLQKAPIEADTPLGLIPDKERFRHICFDQGLADTLHAVAIGARYDLPVALEGETSTTKSTGVLLLAHLLQQPVLRHNLHGQTDSGELVARYVPGNAGDGLDMQTLLALAPRLSPESRALLEQAHEAGRALSAFEIQWLAGREGLPIKQWSLQLGSLVKALEKGLWLMLDELNLGEAPVLERLNSVLEVPRTLVLSEGDGRIYGPGWDRPVHPRFRVFATLNPAEYSGRNVMSPAFRDRFSIWHQPPTPGEADYLAMIRFLVTGHHPVVYCKGVAYQAASTPPLLERLQSLPDWDTLARQLALFQSAVVKAAGSEGGPASLGRTRRERYTFTRRTLLNTLDFIHRQLGEGLPAERRLLRDAIELFYLKRLRDVADRNAMTALLRAADL
jgi:MoxR-like ATPase